PTLSLTPALPISVLDTPGGPQSVTSSALDCMFLSFTPFLSSAASLSVCRLFAPMLPIAHIAGLGERIGGRIKCSQNAEEDTGGMSDVPPLFYAKSSDLSILSSTSSSDKIISSSALHLSAPLFCSMFRVLLYHSLHTLHVCTFGYYEDLRMKQAYEESLAKGAKNIIPSYQYIKNSTDYDDESYLASLWSNVTQPLLQVLKFCCGQLNSEEGKRAKVSQTPSIAGSGIGTQSSAKCDESSSILSLSTADLTQSILSSSILASSADKSSSITAFTNPLTHSLSSSLLTLSQIGIVAHTPINILLCLDDIAAFVRATCSMFFLLCPTHVMFEPFIQTCSQLICRLWTNISSVCSERVEHALKHDTHILRRCTRASPDSPFFLGLHAFVEDINECLDEITYMLRAAPRSSIFLTNVVGHISRAVIKNIGKKVIIDSGREGSPIDSLGCIKLSASESDAVFTIRTHPLFSLLCICIGEEISIRKKILRALPEIVKRWGREEVEEEVASEIKECFERTIGMTRSSEMTPSLGLTPKLGGHTFPSSPQGLHKSQSSMALGQVSSFTTLSMPSSSSSFSSTSKSSTLSFLSLSHSIVTSACSFATLRSVCSHVCSSLSLCQGVVGQGGMPVTSASDIGFSDSASAWEEEWHSDKSHDSQSSMALGRVSSFTTLSMPSSSSSFSSTSKSSTLSFLSLSHSIVTSACSFATLRSVCSHVCSSLSLCQGVVGQGGMPVTSASDIGFSDSASAWEEEWHSDKSHDVADGFDYGATSADPASHLSPPSAQDGVKKPSVWIKKVGETEQEYRLRIASMSLIGGIFKNTLYGFGLSSSLHSNPMGDGTSRTSSRSHSKSHKHSLSSSTLSSISSVSSSSIPLSTSPLPLPFVDDLKAVCKCMSDLADLSLVSSLRSLHTLIVSVCVWGSVRVGIDRLDVTQCIKEVIEVINGVISFIHSIHGFVFSCLCVCDVFSIINRVCSHMYANVIDDLDSLIPLSLFYQNLIQRIYVTIQSFTDQRLASIRFSIHDALKSERGNPWLDMLQEAVEKLASTTLEHVDLYSKIMGSSSDFSCENLCQKVTMREDVVDKLRNKRKHFAERWSK
ncbi:hypothetical protein ADUPG1_006855, partial [Aduncisulcus paluster]